MGKKNSIARGLEYVEWVDSCTSSGWHSSEHQNYEPMRCETFGVLVDEGEDYISIAGTVADDSEHNVCDVMTIPKQVITRRRQVAMPDA